MSGKAGPPPTEGEEAAGGRQRLRRRLAVLAAAFALPAVTAAAAAFAVVLARVVRDRVAAGAVARESAVRAVGPGGRGGGKDAGREAEEGEGGRRGSGEEAGRRGKRGGREGRGGIGRHEREEKGWRRGRGNGAWAVAGANRRRAGGMAGRPVVWLLFLFSESLSAPRHCPAAPAAQRLSSHRVTSSVGRELEQLAAAWWCVGLQAQQQRQQQQQCCRRGRREGGEHLKRHWSPNAQAPRAKCEHGIMLTSRPPLPPLPLPLPLPLPPMPGIRIIGPFPGAACTPSEYETTTATTSQSKRRNERTGGERITTRERRERAARTAALHEAVATAAWQPLLLAVYRYANSAAEPCQRVDPTTATARRSHSDTDHFLRRFSCAIALHR